MRSRARRLELHHENPTPLDARGISGNEVESLAMAAGLHERGHRVLISCRSSGAVERRTRSLGLLTTHIRPTGDADLVGALRFARLIRRERIDAVLLTSRKRVFTTDGACRVARAPHVVLRVGGSHPVPVGRRGWKYRHVLTSYVDTLIANWRDAATHLAGIRGVDPRRIVTVPNGITRTRAEPAPLRQDPGTGDAILLVAVSEVSHPKGYDILLDAEGRVAGRPRTRARETRGASATGSTPTAWSAASRPRWNAGRPSLDPRRRPLHLESSLHNPLTLSPGVLPCWFEAG